MLWLPLTKSIKSYFLDRSSMASAKADAPGQGKNGFLKIKIYKITLGDSSSKLKFGDFSPKKC